MPGDEEHALYAIELDGPSMLFVVSLMTLGQAVLRQDVMATLLAKMEVQTRGEVIGVDKCNAIGMIVNKMTQDIARELGMTVMDLATVFKTSSNTPPKGSPLN